MPFALFRAATLSVLSATLAVGQAPPTLKASHRYLSRCEDSRQLSLLEKDADPEVKAWSAAQNRYARAFLDAQPTRAVLQDQLTSCMVVHPPHIRRCVIGRRPLCPEVATAQRTAIAGLDDVGERSGAEKVVVDPNQIDAKGGTEMILEPSHNGKLVAVSLSQGGSESGDVHVYDASTGKPQADVIPHVNNGTAGGSVAWRQDDQGFYYTRYPHAGERPAADLDFYQQVWFQQTGYCCQR